MPPGLEGAHSKHDIVVLIYNINGLSTVNGDICSVDIPKFTPINQMQGSSEQKVPQSIREPITQSSIWREDSYFK